MNNIFQVSWSTIMTLQRLQFNYIFFKYNVITEMYITNSLLDVFLIFLYRERKTSPVFLCNKYFIIWSHRHIVICHSYLWRHVGFRHRWFGSHATWSQYCSRVRLNCLQAVPQCTRRYEAFPGNIQYMRVYILRQYVSLPTALSKQRVHRWYQSYGFGATRLLALTCSCNNNNNIAAVPTDSFSKYITRTAGSNQQSIYTIRLS